MKTNRLLVFMLILCLISSCENVRKSVSKDLYNGANYEQLIFSDGEYTTFLSRSTLQDTLIQDSVNDGVCLLRGTVYGRSRELDVEVTNSEQLRFCIFDLIRDWPRLIIPELGINQEISQSSFSVEIPAGTYNVIIIAESYYPIHKKWTFYNQHIVTLNCYLGCTVIH